MSKIPSASTRLPRTLLPVPKTPKVLQSLSQNLPKEDPIRLAPAGRMLSRRSKSYSDLRTALKPDLKKLTAPKPSSLLKSTTTTNLVKSTSTSNLVENKKVVVKTTLRTVAERTATKPTARATAKRPAPVAEEPVRAKVSKPAKIPPYDYKARFNQLNEKHASLLQTYKEAQQKLRDNEADLQQFETLKNDNIQLREEYNMMSVEHGTITTENEVLTEKNRFLNNQLELNIKRATELKSKYEDLKANYAEQQSSNESLQIAKSHLESELSTLKQEHKTLKNEHLELRTSHVTLKTEFNSITSEKNHLTQELAVANAKIEILQGEVHDFKSMLQSHEELRRMMHNQIQDLKGTIRVFCRVRPAKSDEQLKMLCNIAVPDEATLEIKKARENMNCISGKPTDTKQEFAFDKVFPPEATQVEVFEELSQLIQSALDGYHVCVFAYGQTGSGKTYTMQGEDAERAAGMIPRTVQLIFSLIGNLQKIGWTYTVEASFLEIYNETVRDLLDPSNKEHLDIRFNEGKGTTVTNLSITQVESVEHLHCLMANANRNRAIAATNFNEHSSRSHAVTKITLKGCNEEMGISYIGSLNLVDLAGSESAKTSSSERITETKNINKSLSTLGTVMAALHNKENHIPYRNSKLTYLLQSCLGGNSKTLMFVNIAPFEECYGESINALRFAAKVKEVKLGSRRNKMYLQRELSNVAK